MVRTEFGLGDGKGPLEGGAGGRQLAKIAEHNPEVIQVESDVEVVGAKLGLQNGQRTLRELTCLLQLRPPPQVASRLIQQVGGQGPLGFQNGSVLGRDQGMGQQPGTGRPGLHIVFRERGPEQGAVPNHKNPRAEPPDHAIGRSRGGLTCKVHLVVDGKGRPLSWALTGGNVNDTTMMTAILDDIRVPRKGKGRPRTRPDRVLADKGYPSKANRTWLRTRGIATTRSPTARRSLAARSTSVRAETAVPRPQRRRTVLQPSQAMARNRDAHRQARTQLPRRDLPLRHADLDQDRLNQHGLDGTPSGPASCRPTSR